MKKKTIYLLMTALLLAAWGVWEAYANTYGILTIPRVDLTIR